MVSKQKLGHSPTYVYSRLSCQNILSEKCMPSIEAAPKLNLKYEVVGNGTF